jgi:hypothetical protein
VLTRESAGHERAERAMLSAEVSDRITQELRELVEEQHPVVPQRAGMFLETAFS